MYGFLKIHKFGIPLKPNVSCRGLACHPLSRFLVDIVKPLTGKSLSNVRNSEHLVELYQGTHIHNNQMVSLDVASLFTRVLTDKALTMVWNQLESDSSLRECINIPIDNLMKMLMFCVQTTFFQLESDIPTGRMLAYGFTVVTNDGKLEYFEEMALRFTKLFQK